MLSGISWPQLLIILVIVIAIFGTKKMRNLGSDLGNAIKGFRSAMTEADEVKEQLQDDSSKPAKADADFDTTPVKDTRDDT